MLAAGVALILLTGVSPLSLRSLRLSALPPSSDVVQVPFRRLDAPRAQRDRARATVPDHATIAFHIPPAARPLIRAARAFLLNRGDDPHQRVFTGFSPMHEQIEQCLIRCGLPLPRPPSHLIDAWQLRVRWSGLDEAIHTDQPDLAGVGRSCLTARPAPADPAEAPPQYRYPHDRLGKRWSPLNPPAFLPGLLRAYLDGTEPTLRDYRGHEATWPHVGLGEPDLRRGLVEEHLAVRVPPTAPEHSGRIILHPDIAFALRLADQPAGPGVEGRSVQRLAAAMIRTG